MPRDIPIGNGSLLICFDKDYAMRELYYPHVGQENHVFGRYCRLGVWVEGQFSWIGPDWKRELRYLTDTMVTEVSLYHAGLQILLLCHDAVDFHENVYVKEVTVENMAPHKREIRLFFTLDLGISGNEIGDTAGYDPKTEAVIHYKGARYLLSSGLGNDRPGLSQYAVGQKGMGGREGTFRDAEDGVLSGNPMAQGSVDSVIAVHVTVEPLSRGRAFFWVAVGSSWKEVDRLNALVKHKHPQELLKRTTDYWRLWVRKESPPLQLLPEKVRELYRRSLIAVRSQIDWQGGIIAANDSDVIDYNRDTYSYVWPRDAALVAHALDLSGHPTMPRNFFRFIAGLLQPEGCLLHKFNPDGTLASSWHPWYDEGQPQLPIQEDSTALVLWALWQHFVLYRDLDLIKVLYRPLIKKAADFMCAYRDQETGLPSPSYDLWEERKGILSFTVGTVFGGLTAASLFCRVFGEDNRAEKYQKIAAEIRDGASLHLWREDLQRFCRMIQRDAQGNWIIDAACDSSLWGLFAFGLYRADDPRIMATMAALKDSLWVRTPVGGMARYENDPYQRVIDELPGNPWFICTLWLADYYLERSLGDEDLNDALNLLSWVAENSLPSGCLAEQLNPLSGEPLSVSPLTWSHATYVATIHRLLRRMTENQALMEGRAAHFFHQRGADWIDRLYDQACDSIYGICRI
ncbi:MAG: glycoside hydrolase family 15 protein [Desulforhabdus sp.]|jgi:GH15 family glucan-1,4-alpha-glucosidase|nr:glycoside hydrolase family 15 protein [Desulforhabdus sp.]